MSLKEMNVSEQEIASLLQQVSFRQKIYIGPAWRALIAHNFDWTK